MKGIRLVGFVLVMLLAVGTGMAVGQDDASEAGTPDDARPQVVREIHSERTASSRTVELSDGARRLEISESPINYRDEDGAWKPIEETLTPLADGGIENGANSFDVRAPGRMGTAPVRLSEGDDWVSYRLLGQKSEGAEVDGGTATYEASDPGTTFQLSTLAGGIKEEIVLDDASQPHSFDFELEAAQGLTPALNEQGAVVFEREGEEQPFAMLPAPIMTDSSAEAMPPNAVSYALEPMSNGNWKLSVDADRQWLDAPEREWPVTIDPPVVTLASLSRDCTIGSFPSPEGWKGCGYQGQQLLYAAYIQKTGEAERSFLRFTMPTLPTKSYVSEAKLSLYSPSVAENTPGVEVRRVTQSWNESLNWKYFKKSSGLWSTPGGDYTSEGAEVLTAQRGTEAGWWEFSSIELAEVIGKWRVDQAQNQGLMVKGISESKSECEANPSNCARRYVAFNSSAAADSTKRPKLSITYYPPAPSTSVLSSPTEGQRTSRRLKLAAKWQVAGVTGVKFQYREGTKGIFRPIPSNLLRDADGNPVTEIATTGEKKTEPVYLDAAHLTPTLRNKGGAVQVRALFEGPTEVAGFSAPVATEVNRFIGGPSDAVVDVGPGIVNLLTGNLGIDRSDVSIPGATAGLNFSRTFNSRDAGQLSDKGVLGQGWKPGSEVEAAGGSEWKNVKIEKSSEEIDGETYSFEYAVATTLSGEELAFEKSGENYLTPPEAKGWKLATTPEGKLTLTEPGGNRTTFENVSGSAEYLPISVALTGGSKNSTQMFYQLVEGKKRLTMMIGPTTEGISCGSESAAKTNTGCRALAFTYEPATKWGAPSGYGERLSKIAYYAPGSGGPWDVAAYSYNSQGRLTEAWDPRISPALVEKYTYTEGGQLATIAPPAQEPWTMNYGAIDEEVANGRLISVKRLSLVASPSVAQTTIAYEVPISGSGAPYEMSASEVAKWGQEDLPVDATAIFGPDEVPASPPSAYSRAAVYYMDAEGQEVNVVMPPGAGTSAPSITTTETDEFGNVVRELSAQNRIRALAKGAAESVKRSEELETNRLYSEDGIDLLEERGPLHPVRIEETGEVKEARLHRTIQYDKGAPAPPAGTPMPHLPTRETVGASIPKQGTDADQRVTEYGYDWTLRQRTETIVDPGEGHLELRNRVAYDEESGLPIERSLPTKPGGGDAHTTKTIYYSAGAQASDPACKNKPTLANLPCKVLPAAQPGTVGLPEVLVTRYASYNALGETTEVIESPGGKEETTRKTITTYDSAGRTTSRKQVGGGTELPPTATVYDKTSGLPVEQKFTCESCDTQATVTAYDALGRPIQYSDADGNTSKATYDLLGRLATVYDGKGTQTFGYDSTTGLLTKLEDSAAGTFTAAYDADGGMVEQGLPNGLVAKTTYDEVGAPTKLSYTKTSCTEKCTWLEESNERSIYGQILSQASLASSQQYSYDKAGRLTLTKDTLQGGGCTTRTYEFDKDSNRKALLTRAPGAGGVCDTKSAVTPQEYTYDAADRLTGEVTYDNFGRITSLPGKYAGGGALATTYYGNDTIASQSQGGLTNTYQLDSAGRPRQVTQTGTKIGTEVFHYAMASDSTAWTERGGIWTRSISGIDGGLAAIQESSGATSLQLTNLHGDVVATASLSLSAKEPTANFEFDEFGNPKKGSAGRYGWLGAKSRRTELPSGVIQMGVRSYVPAMGRFISVDPVLGGSANGYDYANQDPVNEFDLDGRVSGCGIQVWVSSMNHRIYAYANYDCNSEAWPFGHSLMKVEVRFERHTKGWWDEHFYGDFETKADSSWTPRNPSDPKWRHFRARESYRCGDLGREYQITYILTIMYSSPVNGVVASSTEEVKGSGRVKCLR